MSARYRHHSGAGWLGHRKAVWLAVFVLVMAGAAASSFWPSSQRSVPIPERSHAATVTMPLEPAPAFVSQAQTSTSPHAMPPSQSQTQSQTPTQPQPVQPAWLKYATRGPAAHGRPRVAIVIDDCGLDRSGTERAIGLPAAVTLSFLTYAHDLPAQTEAARRHGHEILVHVPMQPINPHIDMGPNGLKIDLTRNQILRRLQWDLSRFSGYVGINNHMGSRFTSDAEGMGWVMSVLKARGLMFLDSRTIATSVGATLAAVEGVPFTSRNVFLDDVQTRRAIEAQLKEVEEVARKRGTAVAIGHPHPATLDALTRWIAGVAHDRIVLVPLTDIVEVQARLRRARAASAQPSAQ